MEALKSVSWLSAKPTGIVCHDVETSRQRALDTTRGGNNNTIPLFFAAAPGKTTQGGTRLLHARALVKRHKRGVGHGILGKEGGRPGKAEQDYGAAA